MNFKEQIPISYILSIKECGWDEIAWGYHQGYLGYKDIIEFANYRLTIEYNELESDLVFLDKSKIEEIVSILDQLACFDGSNFEQSHFWLVVNLAWCFQNKLEVDYALSQVEEIYNDFGCPEELLPFVRYAPVNGDYNPSEHTISENLSRLLKNWEQYLRNNGVDL